MKFKFTKKRIIVFSIIGVVVVAGAAWAINASKPKLSEVTVKQATVKDLSQTISVTGNIEANNSEQIALASTVKVLNVFVAEGQDIIKGASILKLDAKDYEYQLQKAKLNLDLSNINLNKLQNANVINDKKSLENAVTQAELNLNASKRNYDKAKQNYENNKALFESGYISQDEYDGYKKTADDADNQVSLVEIQLTNATNNLADFGVDRSYQIQEQKKQIEMNRSDLANINLKINDSTIKANISGKIVKLDVKANQYPDPQNSDIVIQDLSSYKINIEVSQYDAVTLSLGQKSEIKIKGLDKKYTGTVTYIGSIAELKQSGTNTEPKVEIGITIDNPDDKMKVGYEADAEIVLNEKPSILAVNFESILKDADGKSYVFTLKDNKTVKTFVTTGLETDFDIEIKEGLKDGDSYITNPPETLKDGDMIKIAGGEAK